MNSKEFHVYSDLKREC